MVLDRRLLIVADRGPLAVNCLRQHVTARLGYFKSQLRVIDCSVPGSRLLFRELPSHELDLALLRYDGGPALAIRLTQRTEFVF